MARSSRLRLITAFAAGVTAWEAVVHASLFLNRSTPMLFGVRLIPRLNLVQTLLPAATSLALARYAFGGRDRPPLVFRLVARRLLDGELGLVRPGVLESADHHYAKLAPKIAMAVTPGGRLEVATSAYLLALYRAMREAGISEDRAYGALSRGLFEVMRRAWWLPDAIVPGVLSPVTRTKLQARIARALVFRDPDWSMSEVEWDGRYGLDVTRCVPRDFFASEGAERLCDAVMCRQDVLMADERGVRFTRTGTLARGEARCDFRYG